MLETKLKSFVDTAPSLKFDLPERLAPIVRVWDVSCRRTRLRFGLE